MGVVICKKILEMIKYLVWVILDNYMVYSIFGYFGVICDIVVLFLGWNEDISMCHGGLVGFNHTHIQWVGIILLETDGPFISSVMKCFNYLLK